MFYENKYRIVSVYSGKLLTVSDGNILLDWSPSNRSEFEISLDNNGEWELEPIGTFTRNESIKMLYKKV